MLDKSDREHLVYCTIMKRGEGRVVEERRLWISIRLYVSYRFHVRKLRHFCLMASVFYVKQETRSFVKYEEGREKVMK